MELVASADWFLLLNQTKNALLLGGIYALIAVGYTMVYGIIKLINFAHGEIFMFGAFSGVLLIVAGASFWVALVASMALCAALGVVIDRVAYRPLRQAPRLAALITAIGVSIFLQNLAMLLWGSEQRPFPDLRPEYEIEIRPERELAPEVVRDRIAGPLREALERVREDQYDSFRDQMLSERRSLVEEEAQKRERIDALNERIREVVRTAGRRSEAYKALKREKDALEKEIQEQKSETLKGREFHTLYLYHNLLFDLVQLERDGLEPGDRRHADLLEKTAAISRSFALVRDVRIEDRGGSPLLVVRFPNGSGYNAVRVVLNGSWDLVVTDELVAELGPIERRQRKVDHFFVTDVFSFGGEEAETSRVFTVRWNDLFVLTTAVLMMAGLDLLVRRTRIGKAMRACSMDRATSALMGIRVNRIIAYTFGIGSAMAAVGGILYGLSLGTGIGYRMGFYAGVIAFAAAVLGGIGNLRGAMLGGLILGAVEVYCRAYLTAWLDVSANWDKGFAFAVLILVILVRPTGILGKPEAKRA